MRALLAIALLSSSVLADPIPNAGSTTGTPMASLSGNTSSSGGGATVGITAAKQWHPYTPADHGGFSGTIIVPKPTQDALPYPRGMVIAPPEIGDSDAELVREAVDVDLAVALAATRSGRGRTLERAGVTAPVASR